MRLHLRQVEVRTRAARDELFCVMEEVEREVEDCAGDRLAVDTEVLLVEMPAAWPDDEHRGLIVQLVMLGSLLETDRAAHRIAQVELPVDHVVPRRAVCVLEIRHEGGGARVERVDHHLAIGRAGDLDAAVEQIFWLCRDAPLALTDGGSLPQEVGALARIEFFLPRCAPREQFLPPRLELAMQSSDESERRLREDRRELGRYAAGDGDVLRSRGGSGHQPILLSAMRRCNMKTWS